MKILIFLTVISSFAMASSVKKEASKQEYIIKGEAILSTLLKDKSKTSIVRHLGNETYLVKTSQKIIVDNKTIYHNYKYEGEFKEKSIAAIDIKMTPDPLFEKQTHLPQIKIQGAWQKTLGSEDIIVAITDNEFELDHDDLKHAWWKNPNEIPGNNIDDDQNGYVDDVIGWDFVTQDSNVDVEESPTHGTHVSGIIAAKLNNGIGVAGIAPKVKIMPLRWYGDERRWDTALVVETYNYAIKMGAKIINTSYNIDPLVEDAAYLDTISFAKKQGVIIFNSAGNDNKKDPPRSVIKDIVLVCSVKGKRARQQDQKSRFSNYGKEIDICAPGDPIMSTVQRRYLGESRYGELEGTSMSSPVVAAVAALIWSYNLNYSREEVIKTLINSSDNIDSRNRSRYHGLLGSGRVNATKALE